MRSLLFALVSGVLVLTSASFASAADVDHEDYQRPGFYLLAAAAIGFENSEDLDDANDELDDVLDAFIQFEIDSGNLPIGTTGDGKLDADVMAGVNIAGGYRINPRVAVEGEFEWAKGDIDLEITLRPPGFEDFNDSTKFAEFSYWLLTANAKVFAFTGFIQPFALVGVGVMGQKLEVDGAPDQDDTGAGFRFGGGADVYITRNIAVSTDFTYVLTAGDVKDNDVMSLNAGLLWRF